MAEVGEVTENDVAPGGKTPAEEEPVVAVASGRKLRQRTAAQLRPMEAIRKATITHAPAPISKYPRTGKRGAPQAFPRKLFEILSHQSTEVVSWTDSGEAFLIKQVDVFVSKILMKYFRHNKYSSFQRQLNLYGFRKVSKGPDSGAYAHEHFKRDRQDLLGKVRRVSLTPSTSAEDMAKLSQSGVRRSASCNDLHRAGREHPQPPHGNHFPPPPREQLGTPLPTPPECSDPNHMPMPAQAPSLSSHPGLSVPNTRLIPPTQQAMAYPAHVSQRHATALPRSMSWHAFPVQALSVPSIDPRMFEDEDFVVNAAASSTQCEPPRYVYMAHSESTQSLGSSVTGSPVWQHLEASDSTSASGSELPVKQKTRPWGSTSLPTPSTCNSSASMRHSSSTDPVTGHVQKMELGAEPSPTIAPEVFLQQPQADGGEPFMYNEPDADPADGFDSFLLF